MTYLDLLPSPYHKAISDSKVAIKILKLLDFIIDGIILSQTESLNPSDCINGEVRVVILLLRGTHSIKTDLEKKYFVDYLQDKKNHIHQKIQYFLTQRKRSTPLILSEFLQQHELILLINLIDQYIFVAYFLEKIRNENKVLAKHYRALLPILSNKVIAQVSTDVSDRKKLKESLQTAKKQAEAANQAKTEFLENMRHDIRTPLTGMIGFARLIQNEAVNPRVKEYADNLVLATSALLDFQNNILDAIKITKDTVSITQKNIHLKNLIEKVFDLIHPKAITKNLILNYVINDNIPEFLYIDGKRLFRLILELVTNALKFTAKGKITIHIAAMEKIQNQLTLEIKVSDTGIGIIDDEQEDIFDRFHRLSPSSDGVYEGTGLGLTLVKKYIKDLNGKITVESKLGIGTTFICTIPVVSSVKEISSNARDDNESKILFDHPYILLVEDHEMTARVTQIMLQELTCIVDVASDAKTALRYCENTIHKISLVLLDLGLPDCDGFELAKKIHEKNLTMPIIALTAHHEDDHQSKFTNHGICAILQKPLLKSTAIKILNQYCANNTMKPIIDLQLGTQRIGKNEANAKEILQLLLKNIADDKKNITAALEKKEWEKLRNANHKLLGALAYCGVPRLETACQQLQNALKNLSEKKIIVCSHAVLSEIAALQSHSSESTDAPHSKT